jgi:hypothetical protein
MIRARPLLRAFRSASAILVACALAHPAAAQLGNVDQFSTRGTVGQTYFQGAGLVFQQQVTAGVSGQLTGVEVWVGGPPGDSFVLRVRNGPVPSSQPILWEGIAVKGTSPLGFWKQKLLDTSAAGIAFAEGQSFTLEFEPLHENAGIAASDCTPPCYPDPMVAPFPLGADYRIAFRTFMSEPAPGVNYCEPSNYTYGGASRIWAFGSTSIAANDLVLHAGGMPDVAALFFYGTQPTQIPIGGGLMCVGGGLGRSPGTKPHCGTISTAFDLELLPSAVVAPGTTLYAQAWFRDPYIGWGVGFSDGYAFTLTP